VSARSRWEQLATEHAQRSAEAEASGGGETQRGRAIARKVAALEMWDELPSPRITLEQCARFTARELREWADALRADIRVIERAQLAKGGLLR
jgi:hypothetical protein